MYFSRINLFKFICHYVIENRRKTAGTNFISQYIYRIFCDARYNVYHKDIDILYKGRNKNDLEYNLSRSQGQINTELRLVMWSFSVFERM